MTQREFIRTERLRVFNLKIELEKTVRRDIKSYFSKQRKRVKKQEEIQSIEPVLKKHYERIVRKLIHRNVKQVDRIDEGIRVFLEDRASKRSKEIDNTTQNVLEKSIDEARLVLAEEDNPNPTQRELMISASAIFLRKNNGRITGIANTETQSTTEGLREDITLRTHEELEDVIVDRDKKKAEELYKNSRDYTAYKIKENIETAETAVLITILLTARKQWQTMGDKLVRRFPRDAFDHVSANRQTVGIRDPYIVSGQLMKHPGDSSLGASKGNIINCRCVSVYI